MGKKGLKRQAIGYWQLVQSVKCGANKYEATVKIFMPAKLPNQDQVTMTALLIIIHSST